MNENTHITRSRATAGVLLGAMLGVGLLSAGCRGDRAEKPPRQFFPDMDDQPKWKPQSETRFYADDRTMRQPVAGSVPFGAVSTVGDEEWLASFNEERDALLGYAGPIQTGKDDAGAYLAKIPIPVTRELLLRGQERFNIYCSVCHGYTADGKGMVGQQFAAAVANLHQEKYLKPDPQTPNPYQHLDGYVFHVSRVGVIPAVGTQNMPGYAHALSVNDSWAIVAYLRALQESRTGSISDVPEAQRPDVLLKRPTAPPPTPPTPPPTAPTNAPTITPAPATGGTP